MKDFIKEVINQMPKDWLNLTTHRLDIYDEPKAKTQFLVEFAQLFQNGNLTSNALKELPTAYDYIRLGHPLSSVLEWSIAKSMKVEAAQVICFSSKSIPVMAILRKNRLANIKTRIHCINDVSSFLDAETLKLVYNYDFELIKVDNQEAIPAFEGCNVYLECDLSFENLKPNQNIDFYISIQEGLGSVLMVNEESPEQSISDIQHVRRRETIAMTPANCLTALKKSCGMAIEAATIELDKHKSMVSKTIQKTTQTTTKVLVGSSGLSVQYAIMMGLIHEAMINYPDKALKFIVPSNCYGGTNDQARRIAVCYEHVDVIDLQVDGENDMVTSIDAVLEQVAHEDAAPFIIAEIPTNPRVEVPDMIELRNALAKERKTSTGEIAIDPVFILDQTFCPNIQFTNETEIRNSIKSIAYLSGSKFPSGGKCTAGYCVGNERSKGQMDYIEKHLLLCDNEATPLQYEILAKQMPSMTKRIAEAYVNTRSFVDFIEETLPEAKINFVSEELASQGFTPSVFSLDLPTKGNSETEREAYKRALNLKLINMMIQEIPNESKYCVSYGQLKGCYWTIPATSTQGTTKEGDKDYIARVAIAPEIDLEKHKQVFADFVAEL